MWASMKFLPFFNLFFYFLFFILYLSNTFKGSGVWKESAESNHCG